MSSVAAGMICSTVPFRRAIRPTFGWRSSRSVSRYASPSLRHQVMVPAVIGALGLLRTDSILTLQSERPLT